MRLVTTGTMPHRAQIWNSAVLVPNSYFDTSAGSFTMTFNAPRGLEVHTPPCLVQNEQVQARAGISTGSGSQVREKEMLPQWHLPWMTMTLSPALSQGRGRTSLFPRCSGEQPRDQRPEEQDQRKRGDGAHEAVGPEDAHVAGGADHREAEGILGAAAQHHREGERRQRNRDLL